MNKDVYEYITKFVDDRTIINMLLVNKRFNDPDFFVRVFKNRYPSLMKFRNEDETWKQFYLRMIFYLSKLRGNFDIPYIAAKDFNPEAIYKHLKALNKKGTPYNPNILNDFWENYINLKEHVGHTIAQFENGQMIVEPDIIKGESMSVYFGPILTNGVSIDIDIDNAISFKTPYLAAIVSSDNEYYYSSIFKTEKEALEYSYSVYVKIINDHITDMLASTDLTREEILEEDLSLDENWNNNENKELFLQKLLSDNPPVLRIYANNLKYYSKLKYYFKVLPCTIEK